MVGVLNLPIHFTIHHTLQYFNFNFQFNGLDIFKRMNLQDMVISPDFVDIVNWFGDLTEGNQLSSDDIVK